MFEKHERRIEILKLLQGKEMRISEIAAYFEVDERTIRSDINALRDGLDIFGVKIRIESRHYYEGNPRHRYKSTVHPIMLALNSSELFALLKLLENAKMQITGEVYGHIFDMVYSQITDYAEKLFADKLANKHSKSEVISRLEEQAFDASKDYKLVYWQKSGRVIRISYFNEEGVRVEEEVRLMGVQNNELIVQDKQKKERRINYHDVLIDWSSINYK